MGVGCATAWVLAKSSKGWWGISQNLASHQAMPNAWFQAQGLISLSEKVKLLKA